MRKGKRNTRLLRTRGDGPAGATQVIQESAAPKRPIYCHFPCGDALLAEEAIDQYVADRVGVPTGISANNRTRPRPEARGVDIVIPPSPVPNGSGDRLVFIRDNGRTLVELVQPVG